MTMPEAVINPEITGWLRKLARKPSRITPMTVSIRPDITASNTAPATYSGVPASASGARAAAVINEATATGPTDRVRLVPNTA